jgi:hypothetical protein
MVFGRESWQRRENLRYRVESGNQEIPNLGSGFPYDVLHFCQLVIFGATRSEARGDGHRLMRYAIVVVAPYLLGETGM